MIDFLYGNIASKTHEQAFVDVNGVGFAVYMPQAHLALLEVGGAPALVHTYMAVREDDISLYGFADIKSKDLFKQLISISGIGPKIGLAALSTFDNAQLQSAIASQDVALVSKIPGVGKKSAQRIILELQGKLSPVEPSSSTTAVAHATEIDLATEALLSMGFSSQEAHIALQHAPEDATTEASLIQYALKRLGN